MKNGLLIKTLVRVASAALFLMDVNEKITLNGTDLMITSVKLNTRYSYKSF
ncbi:UNVERIFIED_ORG: hypothetical protein ABIC97_001977 [Peribacillus simplex]